MPVTNAMCVPCPEGLDCQAGADEKDTWRKRSMADWVLPLMPFMLPKCEVEPRICLVVLLWSLLR